MRVDLMFNLRTVFSLCIFLSSLSVLKNIPSLCWLSPSLRFNWSVRGVTNACRPYVQSMYRIILKYITYLSICTKE